MRVLRTILFFVLLILLSACDGPFLSAFKPTMPDDHTESISGVLHKPGYEYPYREGSDCADSDCHHDDLDGGVAYIDDEVTYAPSCFQCHETLWKDDLDEPATNAISLELMRNIIHAKDDLR